MRPARTLSTTLMLSSQESAVILVMIRGNAALAKRSALPPTDLAIEPSYGPHLTPDNYP